MVTHFPAAQRRALPFHRPLRGPLSASQPACPVPPPLRGADATRDWTAIPPCANFPAGHPIFQHAERCCSLAPLRMFSSPKPCFLYASARLPHALALAAHSVPHQRTPQRPLATLRLYFPPRPAPLLLPSDCTPSCTTCSAAASSVTAHNESAGGEQKRGRWRLRSCRRRRCSGGRRAACSVRLALCIQAPVIILQVHICKQAGRTGATGRHGVHVPAAGALASKSTFPTGSGNWRAKG